MAKAHPSEFGLLEDLDITVERLRSRRLANREEISAQIEEATVAREDAIRMYVKCQDEARKHYGRMNEVSRRFACVVAPFQIGPKHSTVLYSQNYETSQASPTHVEEVNGEELMARADRAMREGHAVAEAFKATRKAFEQRRHEFNRSHRAFTPKPRKP